MGSHQNSSSFCSFPSSSSHQHPFIANSATQHFDFDDNQQLQLQQHHQQQQQQQLSNTNSPTFGLLDNPTDTVAHLLDEQCFWNAEEHTNLGGGDVDFDWTSLGLDAFGTQLIQPGTFDLDLATQQCQSSQTLATGLDLESELLLLGAGDMTAAALDGPQWPWSRAKTSSPTLPQPEPPPTTRQTTPQPSTPNPLHPPPLHPPTPTPPSQTRRSAPHPPATRTTTPRRSASATPWPRGATARGASTAWPSWRRSWPT